MAKSILFVDDEMQILKALKRLFRGKEYNVFFADSGIRALEILEENFIDLLISDIRMPNMDGFELLRIAKNKYPATLRVALSGFTDNKKIFSALDDNLAKLYMFKPWDNNELISTIDKIFTIEEVLKDENLLNLINNLDQLPTLPFLYKELSDLVEKDADIDLISKKIEEDQSIASKILKVANSAFYGAKTGSISQAIMYIGLLNVKNIVLTNSVFKTSSNQEYHNLLWNHVNLANKIMNIIYQKCLNKRIPNEYASAGLLHDIGRIIILNFFKEKYDVVISFINENPGIDISKVENQMMGFDHQKIGGYLLNWWEIPTPIVEAALFHHEPYNPAIINSELVMVVHLANYYSWYYLKGEIFKEKLDVRVFETLGVTQEFVEMEIKNALEN